MKKIVKILIFSLIFAIFAGIFTSCGNKNGSEVTNEVFSDSLKITQKNLTADLNYEYDGESMSAVIKIVDQAHYYKSQYDEYWYLNAGYDLVSMIEAIGAHYSELTYADGAYTAESLTLSLTTYEGDAYEWEIVNVSVKINSSGNLTEVYFEEEEEDTNRIYKITFSNYGGTTAPAEEDIVDPDATVDGPSNEGGNMSNTPAPDAGMGGNTDAGPDDSSLQGGFTVDGDGWLKAFNALSSSAYRARLVGESPNGHMGCDYIVVGGLAYYTDMDSNNWSSGSVENFTSNVMPFAELYGDFTPVGDSYYCETSSYDCGDNASVGNVSVRFDENGRVVFVSYVLEINGEQGIMTVYISDYDNVSAPELSENSGSTGSSAGSASDSNAGNVSAPNTGNVSAPDAGNVSAPNAGNNSDSNADVSLDDAAGEDKKVQQ